MAKSAWSDVGSVCDSVVVVSVLVPVYCSISISFIYIMGYNEILPYDTLIYVSFPCFLPFFSLSSSLSTYHLSILYLNFSSAFSWPVLPFQVDLKHIEQVKGSNIVPIGINLREFYMSVEWDILEVPAKRNQEYFPGAPEPYPGTVSFFPLPLRQVLSVSPLRSRVPLSSRAGTVFSWLGPWLCCLGTFCL